MPRFIVNTNSDNQGDHEVHNVTDGCAYLPAGQNRKDLGYHDNCHGAVAEAKKTYPTANGCYYCCKECHTS